jgi:hypothetical protein
MVYQNVVEAIQRYGKVWRLLNVGLFVVSLFGPWGTIFGDKANSTIFLRLSLHSLLDNSESFDFWALYYCLQWVWFVTYWVFNLAWLFEKPATTKWLKIFLALSVIWLLPELVIRLTERMQRFWWPQYYWGYWLMLTSFGSSILLEFILNRKYRLPVRQPV